MKENWSCAGVGWREGYVGNIVLDTGRDSQDGFTLASGEPVVVLDLNQETRFRVPNYLIEHGVVTGVTVGVHGHNKPFGVLGIHSTYDRVFDEDEVHFL